ncbi:MAG: hypothetical protein J6Q94_08995 [Clostridia bacterium]|nr:hypothetical protein [Clostridia bacterium]
MLFIIAIAFAAVFFPIGIILLIHGIRRKDDQNTKYKESRKTEIVVAIAMIIISIGLAIGCFVMSAAKAEEEVNAPDSSYDSNSGSSSGSNSSSSGSGSSGSGSFTNKYGTRTTKCAVAGCSNYIAKSGDTNCCTSHSNKCLECHCYIDSDAMYCMSCIYSAAGSGNKNSSSSKECYVCGESAYSKYGSYYYCSDCLALVKAFSS